MASNDWYQELKGHADAEDGNESGSGSSNSNSNNDGTGSSSSSRDIAYRVRALDRCLCCPVYCCPEPTPQNPAKCPGQTCFRHCSGRNVFYYLLILFGYLIAIFMPLI